ncbi:YqaJ viral recombinase family protein [Hydrogenophaga atypica]|uniref:YqaJ viral recombinase family protein n=1 Tax=Hydrogenophaga atypica TaxID=249409 RepID=A0ABW2QQI3_9BURK
MNLNDIPTPVIVQLQQGSPAWLAYRQAKRNASESAAVMGASPWMTPYQLWLAKTGRQETTVTPAMQRGTDLEPLARAAYEEQTGLVMQPLVLEAGDYSASLDGMTFEGDLVLEIKCPVRGTRSDLWQDALQGEVPLHYRIQVQHQLMVSGAQTAHLWVFDGTRGVLVSIERDEALMEAIRAAWDGFQPHLDGDTPPALSDADTRVRTDQAWQEAARRYSEVKRQADAVAEQLEQARQALVALADHPKESGAGVTVSRYWKQGNVDYKRIPALQGLDLSPYRGRAREEVRVSLG